jgi:hypothetical protein
MADLTESSQVTATTTPQWYTDSMSNLATNAGSAGDTARNAANVAAWDPTALQRQAFTDVKSNVGNYQPGLTQAGQSFQQAGGTDISGAGNPFLTAGTTTSGLTQANPYLQGGSSSAADLVGNYMSPYTRSVVDQIRLANQQNIQQNLSPGLTAGAVGGGQFGSQRGANALALGISNADIGALGQQSAALQAGYSEALRAAQQQRINQLTAGQTAGTLQGQYNTNQVAAGQVAGNLAAQQGQLLRDVGTGQAALASQRQTQGLADVNALATLGGQQQTIAQNRALAPLEILGKQASVLSGANIPTTTTTTMKGSPLSMIAGLGATAAGILSQPVIGKNADGTNILGDSLWTTIKNQFGTAAANAVLTGAPSTTAGDTTVIPGAETDPTNPLYGEDNLDELNTPS